MATHDYVIDNSTGANVRADINSVLQAILSNNSNSSAPSTTAAYMLWADTTANIVKIRNSSNNAWINLFTTAGGVDVDAASNFNEDVTFTTANGNNIVFDKSDQSLEFGDDTFAKFGAGGDLSITHTGSRSDIHSITGDLIIRSDSLKINNAANSEEMARFTANGSVELYYDNTKRIETNNTGAFVTGELGCDTLYMGDDEKAKFGNNDDLTIFHNGTDSVIDNVTGELKIQTDGIMRLNATEYKFNNAANSQIIARFVQGGANELYFDHSQKFQTTNEGVQFFGNLQYGNNGAIIRAGSSAHHFFIQGGASLGGGAIRLAGGSGDGDIRFSSGSNSSFTEKMRLSTSSAGQLLVGCTAEPTGGNSGIMIQGNGFQAIGYAGTGSANMIEFNNANNNIGKINGNGSNTSYITSSDYRLKENASAISDGITRIKALKPYRFNFKTEPTVTQDGFFAHEVSSVVPIAVFGDKDATKEDGSIDPQGIDHSKLVPLLVAAVQELTTKVETLEAA